MASIHRWSMMIYGSMQAEFMETKCNSHIHGYGTSVFGKIVVNTLRPRQNGRHIADDIFKCILLNENE